MAPRGGFGLKRFLPPFSPPASCQTGAVFSVMAASWSVAMAMAKVTSLRESKVLQPSVATPRSSTSPLMPDGAAALTAQNLFPPKTCPISACIGTGECDEACDRLKSTFVTTIPGKRLSFYHSTKQIPFDGLHPNVKMGIIVTSGVLRDAELQICRMLNALVRHYGSLDVAMEEVVVVAPHWQTVSQLGESIGAVPEDELAWSSRPPNNNDHYGGGLEEDPNDLKGWAVGANSTGSPSISSFEVMDELVLGLAAKKNYPNMAKILVVGHGEGGSFVQRYAMFTRVESHHAGFDAEHAASSNYGLSFHVANPSVLLYLSDQRPLQPKKPSCNTLEAYTVKHWKWNFQPLRNFSSRDYMGEDCVTWANNYPYGLNGTFPNYVYNVWKGLQEGHTRKEGQMINLKDAYRKKMLTLYSGQADICNKNLHDALKCEPQDCEMPDLFLEVRGLPRMPCHSRTPSYMPIPL